MHLLDLVYNLFQTFPPKKLHSHHKKKVNNFRAKLDEAKKELVSMKERIRKEGKKQKLDNPELAAQQRKNKDSVRKHRILKKEKQAQLAVISHSSAKLSSFTSPQSLGKVEKHVALEMPKSPRKKKAALACLPTEMGILFQ